MNVKLVNLLQHRGIIKEEDAELYLFGFHNLLLDTIYFSALIVLSLFCGMLVQFMVFWGFYASLRHFAGGYHADSVTKCFFITVGIVLLTFGCLEYIRWSSALNLSVVFVSAVVILLLAPVANINKPLDVDESKVFKRITRIVLLIELIVFTILLYSGVNQAANSITLSLAVMAGMLVLGKSKESKVF